MGHDRVLWILQWVFGLYFIAVGIMHFIVPEGLPEIMSWMYDLSDTVHLVSGTAEILGGLGLILPGLTRIRPELTPLAAVGLIVVMVGAIVWHVGREEFSNIGANVANIVVLSYIAYGRWRLAPLAHRSRINTL
ncbi:MAG: DoxX family protein [Acidimicrobiia bacterium]